MLHPHVPESVSLSASPLSPNVSPLSTDSDPPVTSAASGSVSSATALTTSPDRFGDVGDRSDTFEDTPELRHLLGSNNSNFLSISFICS